MTLFWTTWILAGIIAGCLLRYVDYKQKGEFDLLSVAEIIVFCYLGPIRLSLAFIILKEYLKK